MTVSLDSLDAEDRFALTGRNELTQVLDGIDAAIEAGLAPVKVNSVVIRGINDDQAVGFAAFARDKGVRVRFIEFMPLDNGKVWQREMVVPGEELRERINAVYPLDPVKSENASETARRWRFADGSARRNRLHKSCVSAVLRSLQPNSIDGRRDDPHMPLFDSRTQHQATAAKWRGRS